MLHRYVPVYQKNQEEEEEVCSDSAPICSHVFCHLAAWHAYIEFHKLLHHRMHADFPSKNTYTYLL